MRDGILITFEGGEGAGKTTQIRRVARWLKKKGYSVLLTREPGGTPLADRIRTILLNPKNLGIHPVLELLLYEAARKDHVDHRLLPALLRGAVVLCDRFTDATVAYQGYGRGLSIPLIKTWNRAVTGLVKPRLTFLFDLPARTGLKRTVKRSPREMRFEREGLAFHERVRHGYRQLARRERRITVVDGRLPPQEVFRRITQRLEKALG